MKNIIFSITILLLHFSAILAAGEDTRIEEIIKILNESLPQKWQMQAIVPNHIPDWSFTKDKCILIKIFGPNMAGYKYFRKNGSYIGERRIFNEAIMVWIGDRNFDPKLSFINRIKNRFNIVPRKFPTKIYKTNEYTIYGREGLITLPENEAANKTSPAGTHLATPIEIENGRSWTMWEKDIQNNLKKNF